MKTIPNTTLALIVIVIGLLAAYIEIFQPGNYFSSCSCSTEFYFIKPQFDCERMCPNQ
ncbi:MAG: hypothetical protein GW762_02650 [Candidatus Pacebacteria bacterium]|nr:hypothetical protein [Candidatus Paceibacterota bacterium]